MHTCCRYTSLGWMSCNTVQMEAPLSSAVATSGSMTCTLRAGETVHMWCSPLAGTPTTILVEVAGLRKVRSREAGAGATGAVGGGGDGAEAVAGVGRLGVREEEELRVVGGAGDQEAFPSRGKACRRGGIWAARALASPSWVCRERSRGVRRGRGTSSRRLLLPRQLEAAAGEERS